MPCIWGLSCVLSRYNCKITWWEGKSCLFCRKVWVSSEIKYFLTWHKGGFQFNFWLLSGAQLSWKSWAARYQSSQLKQQAKNERYTFTHFLQWYKQEPKTKGRTYSPEPCPPMELCTSQGSGESAQKWRWGSSHILHIQFPLFFFSLFWGVIDKIVYI